VILWVVTQFGERPTLRGNLSPPFSGPKIRPRRKSTESVDKLMFLLVFFPLVAYSSTLNLEATISSPEKSGCLRNTRCYNPEDHTLFMKMSSRLFGVFP
jgi:hypothetical protein